MKVSIVIPAHNEEDNIPILVESLLKKIKEWKINAEIVIVNDKSTDGTGKLIDSYSKKYRNIKTIHRKRSDEEVGNTMGKALIDGTNRATGDIIVWMMADLSDDLNAVPKFIEKINNGYDMVFGSRYMRGGSAGNLEGYKKLASKGFSTLSRIFIGVPSHDITNAFRAFRKEVFLKAMPNAGDFSISPEFALKAHQKGFRLGEVPAIYRKREKGVARFKFFKMSKKYSMLFFRALFRRL